MKLIKSVTAVGFYTIISRVVGFLRDILMASYIGTGAIMDPLVIAIKIPSFVRRILAEGAFNASFVPMFTALLTSRSRQEAATFAQEVLTILMSVLLPLTLVVEIFMPWIVPLLSPGFNEEMMLRAIEFTRVTFPFVVLISLTALFSSILNSFDRFTAAASSPIAGGVFVVSILLLYGPGHVASGQPVAMAIVGSGVVQLLWVMLPCYLMGMKIHWWPRPLSLESRAFIKRMLPGAVGSGVTQINLFVDMIIASLLPTGTMSFLYYADRFNQLPISVLGSAISTALLPIMARQWRSGDRSNAMHNQNRAIEFSMLVALPMMIGLMYLAYPLILVVFQRNAFSVAATHETAKVLAAFSSGLPAYILVKIFNTSFFSRQDTTTPIRVATISMVLNVVLSLLLMHPLKHVGIALAPSIAAWTSAGILGALLYRQQYLVIDENLKRFIPRVLICCVVLVMVLMLARHGLTPYLESGDGWWIRSLALTALVCIGIVTFLVSSYATGCVDFKDLVQHVTFNDEEAPKSQSYHSY